MFFARGWFLRFCLIGTQVVSDGYVQLYGQTQHALAGEELLDCEEPRDAVGLPAQH